MRNKKGIGLIPLTIIIAVILVIGGILAFIIIKNSDNNNGEQSIENQINSTQNDSGTNITKNVVYKDNSRNIKSTYTFDEATSKFAFKEYKTTLIFQQKDNVKLSGLTLRNSLRVLSFYYEKNNSTYFNFQFEESGSTNVNEFINNFKNGVLGGGKKQLSFENINIIESNDEYVFISCQQTGNSSYNYYFAKQIGNKVFYAHYNSLFEVDDGEKVGYQVAINRGKSEMLIGFKELFSALSIDDNKEPYICDKIMNVPIVLNKQIKNYEFIASIQVVHSKTSTANYRNYMKGFVTLYSEDNKRVELHYDAEQLYNKIEWNKNLSSNIKYSDEDNFFGVKVNNITQIFNINRYENIDNEKSFNEYLTKFFN